MISPQLRYKLALLQIEQYDTRRYLAKVRRAADPALSKRLRFTGRMRVTVTLSYVMGIPLANVLIGSVVTAVEYVVWLWVRERVRTLKKHGLHVVAIAGSYGKTSVKHYVYELLRHRYVTIATPESFNTVFGIAKCLYWEVDERTEVFLAEVGAYHRGDITHLLKMVQPDLGVLTGIARQHLERFGSWENIKQAKGEIAEYMKTAGKQLIANGSDPAVLSVVEAIGGTVLWYGEGSDRHAVNLGAGKLIAQELGMQPQEITQATNYVRPPRSRFELTTQRYGMAVIDNSFSSNDRGFVDALNYLAKQKTYARILVTPGLVELGSESTIIHESLGREIVGKADIVILVGKNERTAALARGIAGKVRVLYIDTTLAFMQTVKALKLKKEPLVLLENDVTENY